MKIILEAMRTKRGMSQKALSVKSGVPQPMISMIESGKSTQPTIGTMYKLALALKCTVDDLVVEDEEERAS